MFSCGHLVSFMWTFGIIHVDIWYRIYDFMRTFSIDNCLLKSLMWTFGIGYGT